MFWFTLIIHGAVIAIDFPRVMKMKRHATTVVYLLIWLASLTLSILYTQGILRQLFRLMS